MLESPSLDATCCFSIRAAGKRADAVGDFRIAGSLHFAFQKREAAGATLPGEALGDTHTMRR